MENKIKLLIVDDEVSFLNSIAKRLEMRDFQVTKATNGIKAMEAARSKKFDLALVDLKMPGMSGQKLLEFLKSDHKFLEVIILTGHGSLESAAKCTKLGAYSYLPKPYEFDRLIELLKEAYQFRLQKKFENDLKRMEKIQQIATGDSALGIMRRLRQLDDDEK
ncbi:MAG: response regulator [Candidatus Electryonea clarkiae]|nr:response regulator [Candidatus Electryonea clarkiae]MDP8287046.1 response regulator [Candidatus Electryonea clarkiae]